MQGRGLMSGQSSASAWRFGVRKLTCALAGGSVLPPADAQTSLGSPGFLTRAHNDLCEQAGGHESTRAALPTAARIDGIRTRGSARYPNSCGLSVGSCDGSHAASPPPEGEGSWTDPHPAAIPCRAREPAYGSRTEQVEGTLRRGDATDAGRELGRDSSAALGMRGATPNDTSLSS